jgi:hypothetical protein
MRLITSAIFFLFIFCSAQGQNTGTKWYSESTSNGIIIQNSYPKGGLYLGPIKKYFNYSYLVFFHRISNKTADSIVIEINFSGDSIAIPNSPDTFMNLIIPQATMTHEKESLFSYGVTELDFLDSPTNFHKTLNPEEDCLFYTVAIFYQTKADELFQERGGNRAEFVLEGQNLFYKIPPQKNSLFCGTIIFNK